MATAARHSGRVTEDGVLVFADPSQWRAAVARHRGRDVYVAITRVSHARTMPQNRLLWLWMREIGDFIGESPEAVHGYLKDKFLARREIELLDGQRMVMPPTTRTLTVEEFAEYMRQIQVWAASFLGLALPEAGALEAVL